MAKTRVQVTFDDDTKCVGYYRDNKKTIVQTTKGTYHVNDLKEVKELEDEEWCNISLPQ